MKKVLTAILLVFAGCISVAQDTIDYEILGISCSHTNNMMTPVRPAGLIIVSQDSILFYSKRFDINPIERVAIDSKNKPKRVCTFTDGCNSTGLVLNVVGTRNDESEYEFTVEIKEKLGLITWTMADGHKIDLAIKRLN